jgi:DNA polymerase III, delta subunit
MLCVGHDRVRQYLEEELPSVTLFRGPTSVGKRTLATYLADFHHVSKVDTRIELKLTTDTARSVREWALRAPTSSRSKVAVLRLDGAPESALNALLKVLEEPPDTVNFLLTSVGPTLPTVESRSHTFRLGLLKPAEVYTVLTQQLGMEPAEAARAARQGQGQVRSAAATTARQDPSRDYVIGVLRALAVHDHDLLDQALSHWDTSAHELLRKWAIEAATGRWLTFSDSETFELSQTEVAWKLVRSLGMQSRPKLAARVALESFF